MTSESPFSRSILKLFVISSFILLIPFTAMQFTAEVNWTLFDFMVAGTLIFTAGFTYLFITRTSSLVSYKIAVGFAVLSSLFMIWSNLAVGIIGSEDNLINLLYFTIPAGALISALWVRFSTRGLMTTMYGCAIGVGLITAIAFLSGMQHAQGSSSMEIIAVNSLFIVLFVLSALLFRYAAYLEDGASEK